jgi:membrane-bound serine protease (ClpP class)
MASHRGPICAAFTLLMAALLLAAAPTGAVKESINQQRRALIIQVDDAIGPATANYVARGLRLAAERGAALVVLRMDTPGGLDSSMRDINRAILASTVPVATYVNPSGARAASAGTYILYASHVAAMTPGTNVGAATPVSIGGGGLPLPGPDKDGKSKKSEDEEGKKDKPATAPTSSMEAKAINDAIAYIRSLAELRSRNVEWAEKAVREAASISASEALKENVIDILASTMDDLFVQANGRKVRLGTEEATLATQGLAIEQFEPDWRTRILATITNPNIALILLMIGIYGLIFEFMNPGALIPGTIGAICLLIGLYAFALLPVNYAGLALIALGIALMIAEAFTPSIVLGVGGVASLALGAAILIDTEAPGFQISWTVIGAVALTSLALMLIVGRLAISSYRRRIATGVEEMAGVRGEVQDWQNGAGHVFAHGERWKAVSPVPLSKGQPVRVTGMDGLVLRVEPDVDRS